MSEYKFFKALYEDELEKKIHSFQKEHEIVSVQYSACPYVTHLFNSIYFSVMVEYKDKE